jgi:GNAT superfamily N-acetyltransferase
MRASQHSIIAEPPEAFSEATIKAFIALVREGEEVSEIVLETNVRTAKCLAIANAGSALVGVAALKNPQPSYRKVLLEKTDVILDVSTFPFEFGYLFVLPEARNQGTAMRLSEAVVSAASGKGVFATVRANNAGMHVILSKLGFAKAGDSYESMRGRYQLQLFVRPGE